MVENFKSLNESCLKHQIFMGVLPAVIFRWASCKSYWCVMIFMPTIAHKPEDRGCQKKKPGKLRLLIELILPKFIHDNLF